MTSLRSPGRRPGLPFVARFVTATVLAAMAVPVAQSPASAAANLTVTPITWGVVGLDSNDVDVGPNAFANGARVCNTGTSAATNVVATHVWTTPNTYINLFGQNPLSVSSLAASACADFYFNIAVTRDSAAYHTTRGFRIDVTADALGTTSTPTPRELYVEELVSQNRNQVDSVTGPTTVVVGNTYTYVLTAHTANGGYEQLASFLNLPNAVFQIVSVSTTYTAPPGGTNDKIYGDGCGWQPNPSAPNYRSCVGPDNYTDGKVGGDVVTTYQVKILAAGTDMQVYGLIYDMSGGSYHYNNDYGTGGAGLGNIDAVEEVDLSLTKSDSPNNVTAGEDLTYTINVANAGPSTAHNVTVTDPLPGGLSFVSADNGGTLAGGTVTWNLGDIEAGDSVALQLVVHVNSNRTTNLSNTATATTTTTDTAGGNNADTEATTVTTSADLSITKTDSSDPVLASDTLTYTLTVANDGPSDASAVQVSDTLPAGVSYVSSTPSQGSCSEVAGVVSCSLGAVADGATATVDIVVTTPSSSGALSNTAGVSSSTSDPSGGNNSDTEGTTVSASADLSITKSDSADPVLAGEDLTYTLVVTNDGPSDTTGVVVTDPVPAGTSFVSADNGGTEAAGVVTWNLGALADGASTTVHVTVHVNEGRTADLSNTASVSSAVGDPTPANDDDTETTDVDVEGDLSITKSDGVAAVAAGGSTTYTITVANDGPSTVPSGVVVADTIPAGTSGSESEADCAISVGTLVCTTSSALAPGASASWDLTVDVDALYALATVSNTAAIASSPVTDPDVLNDQATDVDTVTAAADLSITKSGSADPVLAGEDLTYTLVVTNDGPSDATGVRVTDPIPAGTSFVSADNGGTEAAGTVIWNLGDLADGASATVHVTVHVDEGRTADLSNTASVSGDQNDPDAGGDSATETTTVDESSDLSITKTAAASAFVGSDLTYTIVVTNDGPSTATGVQVTDVLPAGGTYGIATSTQGTCGESGGTVTCDIGSLVDGGSATVTLIVTTTIAGSVDNTATATSDASDPDGSDDSDSASTDVTAAPTSADLGLVKTASPDPAFVGENLTYTIEVTNAGPDTAQDVVVTDPLDAGVSFVSADQGGVHDAGTVTWDLGSVAAGDTVTISLVVHVVVVADDLPNTAVVSSSTSDPDPTDDADSVLVDALDRSGLTADLQVQKTVDEEAPTAGDVVTYTVTVINEGPADATNVRLRDDLPGGLGYRSSLADHGEYDPGTGVWRIGDLPNGATAILSMDVKITAEAGDAPIQNVARVAGLNETDPDGTNDSAERDITVVRGAGGDGDGNGDGNGNENDGTGGSTAFTGANLGRALALLLGFLAAGFVFLVAGRRRKDPEEQRAA